MTRNKLFTALVFVLALFLFLPARADLTIKVQKGGEAPYLYAYDNDGDLLNGAWPGAQYTEKDAEGYWTTNVDNANGVNIIFNNGNSGSGNQTNDIERVPGVDGVAKFMYDGKSTWFSVMPNLEPNEGYIYFNCPPQYTNVPPVYLWNGNSNNGWPGQRMTYVGLDGAGFKVYEFNCNNLPFTPTNLIFLGDSDLKTADLTYVANGYYNTEGSQAQVHALNLANGYTDDNFRAGIAAQLGISDGSVFVPSKVTYLDVSGRQIESLAGISNFHNLQTLIASDNELSTVDLSNNPEIEVLNLSGNEQLRGFNSSYTTNSNYINLTTNNTSLKELYLANCNIGYFKNISSHYGVTSLVRLDLSGNTAMQGWSSGIGAQTGLKYLNVSNNGYGSNELVLTNLTQLDTLIANDNPSLGNIPTIGSASQLRYVSLKNCGLTNSIGFGNNAELEYIDISNNSVTAKNFTLSNNPNLKVFKATNANIKQNGLTWSTDCPALDTLIVSGNNAMQYLNTLHHATGLKYLDMSCGDLYLQSMSTFTGANFPQLDYIDFSNDQITASKTLDGFTALKTLKTGGNTSMPSIYVNNCQSLETLDISGNSGMTAIGLTNQGYTNASTLPTINHENCSNLTSLDLSHNNYTSVPSTLPFDCTSLYLNSNALTGFNVPSGSSVQFLYAENNEFSGALELTSESVPTLKGLDLGNNGITSFKAEGTGLSALMLGNNPQMTTLELHGNDNLTVTTAGTTMSDGSGLYLLGSTCLETIDLSNSSFTQIGANEALKGLTAVKTLNGSHNKFTTFTNSNYDCGVRLASYVSGKASLENLTGLKHLDLSYNELADSVHLYRNTALTWLDVSHNNVIGPLATTDAEKLAMRLRKADLLRKYHCKDTPIGISCPPATQATLDANEAFTHRAYDLRDIDLRDTTGLFHLDLNFNTELEYLNISETNIHNTAAGWWYMNPGWEYGTGGWYSYVDKDHPGTKSPANGCTRHHFVWLQTCGKLEEFHADNNNMQSLGVRTSPYLHTITAKGMYGDCWLMRDAGTSSNPNNLTERGNISISGNVVTYSRTTYTTNADETLSGTVYYKDANGVEGGTNYYPNPVKWYDVSNSGYYAVRTANGVVLEHLDVSGNHLSELKVSGNTKLQYVDTENNDLLTYVDANDLPDLTTLKVAENPVLEKLYADNDPSLPGISGLEVCAALKYLHVQNDGLLGANGFNVVANTNLQSLLASSCNLPDELKVSQCANLDTLSVHNNQLTKLDVSTLQNMHWLNCYNNTGITELNVAANTGMTHLDLHNCSTIDLALATNTALQYFDCDNNKIRELTFAHATDIDTIHANNNNLFQIQMGTSHSRLKEIEFENNHVNAIDLTGCINGALTGANIKDANNGRSIPANSSSFYTKEENQEPVLHRLYYFQLDESTTESGGGAFLNAQLCEEDLDGDPNTRTYGRGATDGIEAVKTLAQDGMVLTRIDWAGDSIVGSYSLRSTADASINPDKVIGTIVALTPTSESDGAAVGQEKYLYDNGISLSEFYLNWTASSDPSIVTELDDLPIATLQVTGGTGCITVTAAQTMPLTVVDLSGRVVATRDLEPGTTMIDGLQPGIYIVAGTKVIVN